MARDSLSASMLVAMNGQNLRPFVLLQLQYSGGTAYVTDCVRDVVHGGNTYVSDGTLLGVGDIEESGEMRVASLKVTLSGVALSVISAALSNDTNGRLALAWMGLLADDNSVIVDPFNTFRGRFERVEINDSVKNSTVVWTLKNEFADFNRRAGRRTNDEEQQLFFVGDRGFEFAGKADQSVQWGVATGWTPPPPDNRNAYERAEDEVKGWF